MPDDETPAPEEANPNQAYEQQVMAALAENDKQAQAVVTKMVDGTLTEAEGQAQLKAVRDQATQAGVIYGQQAGGLSQVKGLLEEMGKGGVKPSTITRFQKRVDGVFSGKPDADLAADLAEEIRTGVESRRARVETRAKGGSSRRSDNEILMDVNTPMEKIREIRARQRVTEGW